MKKMFRSLALFPLLASLAPAKTVRIMPLGDSITKGNGCVSPPSYRKYLSDSLLAHGADFDFVGSLTCSNDLGYDTDHQGLSGSTTFNTLHAGQDSSITETLYDWAPRYKPDIVLIHLGTNDVAQNFTPDSTLANLTEIVRVLRSANPQVNIFIAQILPMMEKWGMKERAIILNDSIAQLAKRLDLNLVDQFSDIIPDADLHDGTHPNPGGYDKMAKRWFAALTPFLFPINFAPALNAKAAKSPSVHGYLINGLQIDENNDRSMRGHYSNHRYYR